MEQQHQQTLTQLVNDVYNKPDLIEDLLKDLLASAPAGFEGMATMIHSHFVNGLKSTNPNIQKFELESGLLKLKPYFQRINQ